jgi:thioesterase domain-containing protein
VNRVFGVDLPVATLFEGATVRHMARAVGEQARAGAGAPSSVVPLRATGTHPPLFCIHPADRRVFGYLGVARHLGPEQPVHGLRDVGEDLARPVPVIAAEHVAALREVQPRGPYYLLGWSFGGFVAHEMAVQLRAAGEEVAFTGLLDAMSPELARAWPWARDADTAVTLAMEAAARRALPFKMRPEEVEGLELEEQARRIVRAMRAAGAAPPGFDAAVLVEQVRIVRARNASRGSYTPGVLDVPLTLFRATDAPPQRAEFLAAYTDEERRTLGWCRHAALPVEVRDVAGEHATVGADLHVRALVRDHLAPALAAARARAGVAAAAEGA